MRRLALVGMAAWFGLVPAFGQAPREMKFDITRAELRPVNGRWLLMADGRTIKDLGPNQNEAQEAVQLIRSFNLNQYGVIGTPRPVMEYWLSDGHAPLGLANGLQRLPFDAASLCVEAWQGQWCLRDARRALFVFGPHEADARQALAVLQRHGFNQVGYVGLAAPVMMCFWNDPDQPAAPQQAGPSRLDNLWGFDKPAEGPMPPGMLTVRQLNGANPLQMAYLQGADWQPIDWQRLEVRDDGRGWKLFAGSQCLAEFGRREEAARLALAAVQHFGFTELVRVGDGPASFVFYLNNGQPPQGIWFGLRNVPFRSEALTVRPDRGGAWMVCQEGQPLFRAGASQAQADQVLQLIQRFGFNTFCQVGEDGRGMSYLTRNW